MAELSAKRKQKNCQNRYYFNRCWQYFMGIRFIITGSVNLGNAMCWWLGNAPFVTRKRHCRWAWRRAYRTDVPRLYRCVLHFAIHRWSHHHRGTSVILTPESVGIYLPYPAGFRLVAAGGSLAFPFFKSTSGSMRPFVIFQNAVSAWRRCGGDIQPNSLKAETAHCVVIGGLLAIYDCGKLTALWWR